MRQEETCGQRSFAWTTGSQHTAKLREGARLVAQKYGQSQVIMAYRGVCILSLTDSAS